MTWIEETEGQYLSAKDLGNGIESKKVKAVEDIEYPAESGTIRHVLRFDAGKSLMLNKTNMRILIDSVGKDGFDPNKLVGKTVFLMKQKVAFQGELVDGIRIVKVE